LPDMLPVATSARIRAASYDLPTRTLTVELADRSLWEYPDVGVRAWEAFMDGTQTDSVFDGIEYRSKVTKTRVEPEAEESSNVGEQLAELKLREFGEPGSATRQKYEELMRRREELPVTRLVPQLQDVRALLAQTNPNSSPSEVAGLILEELALVRIIETAAPARDALDAEIENLARYCIRERAESRQKKLVAAQLAVTRYGRLGEVKALIRTGGALTNLEREKQHPHQTIPEAMRARLANWVAECSQLRSSLGLPDEPPQTALPPPATGWSREQEKRLRYGPADVSN